LYRYQKGQVARGKLNTLVNKFPSLKSVFYMIINLCRVPIKNGKCVRDIPNVKLTIKKYAKEELDNLIEKIEMIKEDILKYIFLGTNKKTQPKIFSVSFFDKRDKKDQRKKICFWLVSDLIKLISSFPISINSSGSEISFGDIVTMQRKGGDSGRASANNFQFKFQPLKVLKDCKIKSHIFNQ
jgi:hypothetical protein